MPYEPNFEGDEIAGVTAGFIVKFTEEENFDNLAQCLSDQSALLEQVNDAVDTLMSRYNADVIESVAKIYEIIKTLD